MTKIHSTAIIGPKVELADDVEIGPYCVIDGQIQIGARTRLANHVTIAGNSKIGADNIFFPSASIGQAAQSKKREEAHGCIEIGDNNIFREYMTVNLGAHDDCRTVIGNHNLFMTSSHIAHDCKVGNHVVISNLSGLAGHVLVEDYVTIGFLSGIHQFCRIGCHCMIGASTLILQDIPPYVLIAGNPAQPSYINQVGLRRARLSREQIDNILELYRISFRYKLSHAERLKRLEDESEKNAEAKLFHDFFCQPSKRGIIR